MIEELFAALRSGGADITAPADLRGTPPGLRDGFTHALVIGAALDPDIIRGIAGGPTWEYLHEYRRANELLSALVRTAADALAAAGSRADPVEPTVRDFDRVAFRTRFPHKTAATRAGIGWIGKNDLLITPRFGSAVRLATVLTDADLGETKPVDRSRCGSCAACVEACPARAISGRHWEAGLDRDEYFDVRACHRVAKGFDDANGFGAAICGICIAVCPWTKRYIENRSNTASEELPSEP